MTGITPDAVIAKTKRHRYPKSLADSFANFKDPKPPEGKDEDYKVSCYSKDNPFTAREMFLKSSELCLFDCKICKHTFRSALYSVVQGRWCGYCSGRNVCGQENCIVCKPKTMASIFEIEKIWSYKNTNQPHEVLLNSGIKIWIKCQDCDHHYNVMPYSYNQGNRCSYCYSASNTFCIQTKEDIICGPCFKRSFASHPMSIYWNYDLNGTKTPYNIAKNYSKKCTFNCPECKEIYETSPNSIVNGGSWCNCVRNKTETLVYKFLIEIFGRDNVKREYSNREWSKYNNSNGCFRFDFLINSKRIIIEVDGKQHFNYIDFYIISGKKQCTNDCFKMYCAVMNNYSIIRICQEDIWKNKFKWKKRLRSTFDKIDKSKKPEIYYLSKKKNLYNNHKNEYGLLILNDHNS